MNENDISQALQLIHNPSTSNVERQQASDYLERFRNSQHAAEQGFALAKDNSQQPLVRHFGLSTLDHVIRHQLHDFDHSRSDKLRKQVIELGVSVTDHDPIYVRNKVAELWIELAKQCWALDWFDLDQLLCGLWYQGHIQQGFVLTVLENLSDDVFVREDTTAVLRGKDLNSALVEVFTAPSDYSGGIKIGTVTQHVRSGHDGWLRRIAQYLNTFPSGSEADPHEKATALRALAAIRSAFGWIMSSAIVSAECLPAACKCLMKQDEDLIVAALDALLSLYGRHNLEEAEVQALVYPLCQPSSVSILQQVYTWSVVNVDEIDSGKYTVSKKLSELVSLLSDSLTAQSPPSNSALDIDSFLQLTIDIAQHSSLIVSIPAVHSWVKLLATPQWRRSPAIGPCVAPLLNVVCSRMIQYDQLPTGEKEIPEVKFVNDEIEIHHERTGFFMNYRRLCASVIDWVCYTHLEQALEFILVRVTQTLNNVKQADASLDLLTYQRVSAMSLQADAQFAIVEAAFKGFERWQTAHTDHGGSEGQLLGQRLRDTIKSWATELHSKYQFRDPQIKQRQIKTMVETSSRALQKDTAFAFIVLEHIMGCFITAQPEYSAYTDAVNDLHSYSTSELRRLAIYHANYFATFYDQLTQKFTELVSHIHVDAKIQVDLKSILFLIVQRAHTDQVEQQQERLWSFLQPLEEAWNNRSIQTSVMSFDSYTRSQAFDMVGPFMNSMHASEAGDWTTVENSSSGMQLQQRMTEAFFSLPLRESRVLLSLSTERLEQDSQEHKLVSELWLRFIGTMLHSVLRLTSYNHKLHDPSSWPNITNEQLPIIRRILRDRYWQSGISEGSMNEFHMKVKSSKFSLEGFASSVRARIRTNLEQCYSIIHTLGRLGERFYSLDKLPSMIAETLLASSAHLSPHHFSIMLAMMPKLIEECPPHLREHFLTPIMAELLLQTDAKLTTEWQNIGEKKAEHHEDEDLNNEMRDDSVLRQTTYKAVNMVATWVDPKREEQLINKKTIVNGNHLANGHPSQSIREFVLSNKRILERLLIFVTHALTYKDTKTCYTMIVAAQRMIPHFVGDDYAPVREYISEDMLRAAVVCIHDGYYAEYQQHYAQLVALIWLHYGLPAIGSINAQGGLLGITSTPESRPPLTNTPREVLSTLPGMASSKLDAAANALVKEGTHGKSKKLRAIVLSLLEGVRGVRLSELGKIDVRQQHSRILELYKQRESMGLQTEQARRDDTDYGGVGEMLG